MFRSPSTLASPRMKEVPDCPGTESGARAAIRITAARALGESARERVMGVLRERGRYRNDPDLQLKAPPDSRGGIFIRGGSESTSNPCGLSCDRERLAAATVRHCGELPNPQPTPMRRTSSSPCSYRSLLVSKIEGPLQPPGSIVPEEPLVLYGFGVRRMTAHPFVLELGLPNVRDAQTPIRGTRLGE